MRKKLQDTPLQLRRRVADKLESIKGTAMAPGVEDARLGDEACPIYRPDIKGVAYWEFEIAGLKNIQSREHKGKSSGVGFIIASTGKHDIPIPHWSLSNEPPSRALEAKSKEGKVSRILKLDTLSYAAEDEKGKYLAHIGQFPHQIPDMNIDLKKLQSISTVTASPKKNTKNDSLSSKLTIESSGAKIPKYEFAPWKSLDSLKRGYAKSYKTQLKALADRAKKAWEIENLIIKFGEGIHEGQRLTVPLLRPGEVKVSGEGANLVKLTLLDRRPPVVTLEVISTEEKKEANFQLLISYNDGTSETLQFFVIPNGTPSNNRSVLPNF